MIVKFHAGKRTNDDTAQGENSMDARLTFFRVAAAVSVFLKDLKSADNIPAVFQVNEEARMTCIGFVLCASPRVNTHCAVCVQRNAPFLLMYTCKFERHTSEKFFLVNASILRRFVIPFRLRSLYQKAATRR